MAFLVVAATLSGCGADEAPPALSRVPITPGVIVVVITDAIGAPPERAHADLVAGGPVTAGVELADRTRLSVSVTPPDQVADLAAEFGRCDPEQDAYADIDCEVRADGTVVALSEGFATAYNAATRRFVTCMWEGPLSRAVVTGLVTDDRLGWLVEPALVERGSKIDLDVVTEG